MRASTRDAMLSVLTEDWQCLADIAKAKGETFRSVQMKMNKLYAEGDAGIERTYVYFKDTWGGGRRGMWRKLPPGYVAPLYDPQPGYDARALDEALGGFSYARSLTIEKEHHGKRQQSHDPR